MKRNVILIGCILILLIVLTRLGIWGWQVKNRCQFPLLPKIPAQIPADMFGFKGQMIWAWQESRKMPPWWRYQIDLPYPEGSYTGAVWEIGMQDNNVWLLHSSVIRRYNRDTGTLIDYRRTESGQEITWIGHLLVSQDNNIWAIIEVEDTLIALANYDAEKDSFGVVRDKNNLISNWEGVKRTDFQSNMADTSDGQILIPIHNNIYQFSPYTNNAQKLLPASFNLTVNTLTVADNLVWFTAIETTDLWSLNLYTKEITNYGHVLDKYDGPIAVDYMGRVWIGYAARLEPDERGRYHWWQPESYPPEFVYIADLNLDSLSGRDDYELVWASVLSIKTSSDGRVWFSTSSGVVNYDIYQDDWCLSAPVSPYGFSEDKDGYLWIATYRRHPNQSLYKYRLGK